MSADVIINNASGVTFSANNRTLNGNLTLTSGTLATLVSAITRLTMGTGPFTINRSGGSITGTLQGTAVYDVSYTGASKTTGPELGTTGLRNVTVGLTAGQTLTLDQDRAPDGDLTVNSGILDLLGFAIDRSASGGGIFTLADGAALVVGGEFNFPESYDTYSLGATSTVEYDMPGDQTVFAETYGNLIFSGSGDKSMAGGTSVGGNLSIPPTGTAKASVGTGLNLPVGSLTLGGLGTASGTWGSTTATSAAYQDDNYFAATTGYLTVSSDTRLTPSITGVTGSQTITYGTPTVTLSGTVSATGPVYPADGETVTVTINGTPQDATISGGAGGFSVDFSTATIPYSATVYTITYAYEGNGVLQAAPDDISTALTVNKATVTAGLTGTVSKTYDGETTATLAAGNYTLGGVFSGDTVTLNNPTSGSYDTRNQGTGKTVSVTGLSISGVSADNYTLASTSVSGPIGTIAAKELTVTGAAVTTKAYDGNTDAVITGAALSGVVGTEDVTLANASTGTFDTKDIGTGKSVATAPMTLDGTAKGNYALTQPTLTGDDRSQRADGDGSGGDDEGV